MSPSVVAIAQLYVSHVMTVRFVHTHTPSAVRGSLPTSSLRLLAPPLRVVLAVMWKVVHQRNIKHYGKVEEFVSLVTEAVPDILTNRQMRLLTLGLRAKMTLQMLCSEESEDLKGVGTHFNNLLPSISKQLQPDNEVLEDNFVQLVQRLLEDPEGRQHFLKNVFPVEYGPSFDTALETLIFEFFTRLEELVLIPDFKQTAVWISDTSSVLEEYTQCVTAAEDFRVLLRSKVQHEKMAKLDSSEFSVPLSSLALLVPPLRLMSAVMWEVVRQRNIKHYGKLEEFVSMVTDAVPELMSKREGRLLSLGLRARNVFPVEYGPDFDTALETLVCEFFTRLEELLPIPDFKQTASWISAAPSVLEEYMQCVSNGDDLKFLLQSKQCHGKLAKSNVAPFQSDDLLIPSLSLPPSLEVAIASHPSGCDDENNDVPQIVIHHCPKRGRNHDCGHCGKTFQKSSSLKEHLLTHVQSRLFKCSHCGVGFSGIGDLKYHQQVDHDKPYQCKQCGKSFISSKCLTKHQQRHQEVGEMEATKSVHERVRHQCVQLLTKYECSHCGKTFKMAHLLRNHQMSEHQLPYSPNHRFRCRYCDETFPGISELKYHQRVDHEKPYQCQECGKCFLSEKCLANH
ncbi:hypothetical protein INR49_000361, partial [Caranx melampygus]